MRSDLQRYNTLADCNLHELPTRAFPAHDPVDQVRRIQIRNSVIAPPHEVPFWAASNERLLEFPVGLQDEWVDER